MVEYTKFHKYIRACWRQGQMRIVGMQIAIFFDRVLSRPDTFGNLINEKLGNWFENIPQVTPWPEEVPVDVPIVQMSSNKHKNSMNVSRARIDLFLNADVMKYESVDHFMQQNRKLLWDFIKIVSKEKPIIRLGINATAFQEEKSAASKLIEKYFSYNFGAVDELSFHVNKKEKINGLRINNILNVNVGGLTYTVSGKPEITLEGLVFQRDFNNDPGKQTLSFADIESIFNSALTVVSDKNISEVARDGNEK